MRRRLPKLNEAEKAEVALVDIHYMVDRAGRREAGLKGRRYGDCVTRAIAYALDFPYVEVREALQRQQAQFAKSKFKEKSRAKACAHFHAQIKGDVVQRGVHKEVYGPLLESLGLVYQPCPTHRTTVAEPCIPPYAILEMPRHLSAMVGGAIVDSWDCRQTRVEGFWYDPTRFSVDYDNGTWQPVEKEGSEK